MNLLLVDDEQLIREGMAFLLGNYDDLNVVCQASNGEEALGLCKTHPIDIILMDIRMPIMDGCLATKLIKEKYPQIKILILTTFKDEDYIEEAIRNGASGYLLKNSSPQLIYTSLKTTYNGGFVIEKDIAKNILNLSKSKSNNTKFDLSDREMAMIQMMADGYSNKDIGNNLFLTEGTVKNSITNLLSKLNLKDRTQVVTFAFRNRLVE